MDLVLADTDGPVIADFKTTARSGEPLEIAHEIQLSCYALLFRHVAGVQEGGLEIRNLVKTKMPQVQFHRYSARNEKHFSRLFAVVRAYLDDLDSGKYVFRPGLGCGMCDFRRQCLTG
jgi:predicted RecB family nuclease